MQISEVDRLDSTASRTISLEKTMPDFVELPTDLPVPVDDGAAAHLVGAELPDLILPATDGTSARTADFGEGRTVIYFYPLTGRPGTDLPEGWDSIPGARGCTTEACDFRDHHEDLRGLGVYAVYGISSQSTEYQAEVAARLRLPFTMLSDEQLRFAEALNLPTFQAPGHDRLYSRLTLIVRDGRIEHVFYPIFPPNTHAQQVVAWLRENPSA